MDLNRIINALSLAALAVLVGTSFLFKVDETQHALLFQFGEVVKTEFEPGLHFKVPVINEVRKYDDRVLTLDNRAAFASTAPGPTGSANSATEVGNVVLVMTPRLPATTDISVRSSATVPTS